ncbi:LLM class F420-dependent oxidoreductase [Actinomycetospora sp. TBRC 11914]|uniref:LLM class F420-dependent oxidoreductase n=1 Tax=Actinomycetospora sp. TBRC 11914 TaxID=2729387 RepID=UPI00145DB852|nr:LLM class F420-dependent oxidoreductase [Actinomycetospora sp. TBRC 11914]NMO93553.1 LLM class F420-dependent oxidoreductase [Actinomycetospora sp. TBRC 11914]
MTVAPGRYGVFARGTELSPELVATIERLGYGAVWLGGSPPADLEHAESLLAATDRLVVATGIVNMWASPAAEVATSYRRIAERYPDRFLLGVGIGHPEAVGQYRKPYATIVEYLDELDAGGVPVEGRALAALGPKVLAVARDRTAGAHPYLTTPTHTRGAREILGAGPLLAPEQKVVVDTDVERARAIGREKVRNPYLKLTNYRNNLLRTGFTEEDLDTASDALVDALAVHGDPATVAAGLTAHLDAGADHVCAQVLVGDPGDYIPALTSLAGALEL